MLKPFFRRLGRDLRIPFPERSDRRLVFWAGASLGVLLFALTVWGITGYHFRTGLPPALMMTLGLLGGLAAMVIFAGLSLLAAYSARALPNFFLAAIGGAIGALITARFVRFRWPDELFYPTGFVFLWVNALLFGSLWVLARKPARSSRSPLMAGLLVVMLGIDALGLYWLTQPGRDPFPVAFEALPSPTLAEAGLANPAEPGNYDYEYFTYGSGNDRHRKEYGEGVRFQALTVDASRLLPEWKGSKKKWRERYWGFGAKAFPLNGRVWQPLGNGPFPLILIVHGNHGMEEHSDPGYAYLGELLASRGFIAVSVDENFVNSTWSGDFRGREMPVRAWLLLKHLEQWRSWDRQPDHPLAGKADLDKVILIGHSRGGEAVAIAAAYNTLPCFPDEASVSFDFGFGIQGLVAIAPTDKRYQRRIELKDVSYLSIQGTYDSDEASFFGLRQYQRITFTDSSDHFKAGLLIHRANHGQFNTTWGRADAGAPYGWLLNLQPLISGEAQRRIARTYIGAFAETVLHRRQEYLPLFKNAAAAREWLPETTFLNNFKDGQTHIFLDFEEDIDLITGRDGSRLQAKNLKVWREEELLFRDKDTQGNNALVLGWDYGGKLPAPDSMAVYRIDLPPAAFPGSTPAAALLLSVAAGNPDELKQAKEEKKEKKADRPHDPEPDFSIELEDTLGRRAAVILGDVRRVAPRLQVQFLKTKALSKALGSTWEAALETIEIPLSEFRTQDNGFNLNAIQSIRLIFDQSVKGVVIVDELGLVEKR